MHCDLVHKDRVAASPSLLYADAEHADCGGSIASRLGVLVVEPTGRLSPVSYGFHPELSLGSLRQAMDTSRKSIEEALPSVTMALKVAGVEVLRELNTDDDWVVLNPSAELSRMASLLSQKKLKARCART